MPQGQYALVQPIVSNFAERCIYAILTTKYPEDLNANRTAILQI